MKEVIGTLRNTGGTPACTLFLSHAEARQGSVRIHWHTEYEISLVLSGVGVYQTAHGTERIEQGDIFVFSSSEEHCITDIAPAAGDCAMELLNLHFSPVFVWAAGGGDAPEYRHLLFERDSLPKNKLDRANPHHARVAALLTDIREEFERAEEDYPILVRNKLVEILITLRRYFCRSESRGREVLLRETLIRRMETAANYITQHAGRELTLSQIAGQVYLSPQYFSAVFKRVYGMSPWEYLTIQRVERAKHLLKTTDASILDIAVQCGFNNSANFNKLFKKYTHTTPTHYRG